MTNCSDDKDPGSKRCQSKRRNSRLFKCDDPGISPHSTRIPDVREGRFRPNEVIRFDCDDNYSGGVPRTYWLKCLYTGKWSTDKPRCNQIFYNTTLPITSPDPFTSTVANDGNGSIIAVVLLSCVSIISFIVLLYLYLTRCRQRSCREARLHCRKQSRHVPLESCHPTMPENLEEGAVLIKDFGKFVALRHNNGDELFHSEFDEIQNRSTLGLTSEASQCEDNRPKNRYSNISAFDHSRVLLHTKKRNGSGTSDYINANFVSSFEKPKAYIACQGPLPETFADFWQMVWENNVTVIVMITNLMEKGRRKCDQYWPQDGREQYRNFQVTLRDEDVYANYTVRTLQLRDQKQSKRRSYNNERRILQYHYTQWPDHGTPEYILPLLTFIRRSTQSNAPIVVHCSAGVGRSGAYIMLDSMIKMARATGQVNVNKFLKFIRTQRNHLVQTVDQYTFLFDALLCHFICGDTECPAQRLKEYVDNLTNSKNGTASLHDSLDATNVRTGLENQFLIVTRHVVRNIDYDFAKRKVNEKKNRANGVLPIFCSRVPLNYRIGSEGSDYINASYLQGYRDGKAYIVTQLPLEDTCKDFWSLVWDYNCPVIITIRDKDWIDDDVYWPSGDEQLTCPLCNVSAGSRCEETLKFGEFRAASRDFVLEATKDDYVLSTVQIDIDFWPTVDQLNPDFCQLLSFIDKTIERKDGSVIIQDRFGSTAAAQLACALNLHQQLANENVVDVFQTVRVAYQMRPGIFESSEDLHFLYMAMLLETHPPRRNNGISPQIGKSTVEITSVSSDKTLLLANEIAENPSDETESPVLGECSKTVDRDDTKSATSQYDVIDETADEASAKNSDDTTNENIEMDESVTSATNLLA